MKTDGFRLTVPMTSLGVLATEDSILLIWPTRQFGGRFARPRAIANRCGRIGKHLLAWCRQIALAHPLARVKQSRSLEMEKSFSLPSQGTPARVPQYHL